MNISIQDYVSRTSPTDEQQQRFGKTINSELPAAGEEARFSIFFHSGRGDDLAFAAEKASTVVGREATCDLYIESFQVSRRHCLLQITDRGLSVKDLVFTNGTFVNGIPLKDGYINDGDRLSLGTYVMTLRREKLG